MKNQKNTNKALVDDLDCTEHGNKTPFAIFKDSKEKTVYSCYFPHEPYAEWFVKESTGPYTVAIEKWPINEIGLVGFDKWIKQCEATLESINAPLRKAPTTRPAQAESITTPEKAKSDKLGLGLVMIPFYSIYRIGKIFIEGLRYGKDNWKKGMNDKEWQEERLEHAINHLFLYKEGDRSEDHLAKVAWFCLVQMELTRLEQHPPCYDVPEKDIEAFQKAINESYQKARCQIPDGESLLPEIRQTRSLEDVYEQLQMAIHKIDKLSEQDLPKIF